MAVAAKAFGRSQLPSVPLPIFIIVVAGCLAWSIFFPGRGYYSSEELALHKGTREIHARSLSTTFSRRRKERRAMALAADSVHEHEHVKNSQVDQSEVRKKATLSDATWNDKFNASWVDPMCHLEEHAEYEGDKVVRWGADHIKETAGDCCLACTVNPDCNVWVWCASRQGCGAGRQFGECWLKHAPAKTILEAQGSSHPRIGWSSGAVFNDDSIKELQQREKERLEAVRNDPDNPLVFLDISIKGEHVGRILISLFAKTSPRAAENFRQLCTGEAGVVPPGHEGAGSRYHLKGTAFYRIIDRFINQGGANTDSVFGGQFRDDKAGLALKHDRKGLLSMANAGPDTNTSHFSILMAPAPHLDGHYTVFGEIVDGFEVAQKINRLAKGKPDNQAGADEQAIILNSGQLAGPKRIPITAW